MTSVSLLVAALLAIPISPLSAQTEKDDEKTLVVEEIVVTAQRREEKLQDVPVSVSMLQNTFLDEHGVRTLQDLSALTPGFVATDSVVYGTAPLSIRGIGGANGGGNFFADEPVAIYVDGIYIGRLGFSTSQLLDVESIEVLRGPQGTLYGRNSTAGALLVKSARPTASTEGYLRSTWSDLDELRLMAAVSGNLVENKLNARAAFGYADKSAWGKNPFGTDVGRSEDKTARIFLEWLPSERVSIDVVVDFSDRQSNPATLQIADLSDPFAASPYVRRPDFDQVLDQNQFALDFTNYTEAQTDSLSLAVNYDMDWASLDYLVGFRDYDAAGTQDSDGTGARFFTNFGSFTNSQWSQEARLTSLAEGKVSWVAGVQYFHEKNAMDFGIQNHMGLFGLGTNARFDSNQDLDAWALFADLRYAVNPKLTLGVGGRFSSEEKDFNNDLNVSVIYGGTIPESVPGIGGITLMPGAVFTDPPPFAASDDWNDFSPRFVVDYQANDQVLTYLSYTQGFKSGGFNSFGFAEAYEPESIDAFELGIKSDLLDSRLRLNVSAFRYDYTDLQVRLGVPTGGVEIANAAGAKIRGLELELTAVPSAKLRFQANLAFLDAKFTEGELRQVPLDLTFAIGAPIPLEQVSVRGNTLSRAPDLQAYVGAEYHFKLGTGRGFAQLGYRYQDNIFFLETGQDQNTFRSDSWSELDMRLTFIISKRWEVALFGRNIGDERHITQVTQLAAFPNGAVNEPRKWGIQIGLNF
jgi:iron complex outermembrane receptor protein